MFSHNVLWFDICPTHSISEIIWDLRKSSIIWNPKFSLENNMISLLKKKRNSSKRTSCSKKNIFSKNKTRVFAQKTNHITYPSIPLGKISLGNRRPRRCASFISSKACVHRAARAQALRLQVKAWKMATWKKDDDKSINNRYHSIVKTGLPTSSL